MSIKLKTFKFGDEVELSMLGKEYYIDNILDPHDQVGIVIGIKFSGYFHIKWESGYENSYLSKYLIHSSKPSLKDIL